MLRGSFFFWYTGPDEGSRGALLVWPGLPHGVVLPRAGQAPEAAVVEPHHHHCFPLEALGLRGESQIERKCGGWLVEG